MFGINDQHNNQLPAVPLGQGYGQIPQAPGIQDQPVPAPLAPPQYPQQPGPQMSPAFQPTAPIPASSTDDLLEIKQRALENLAPLVDHLDQTPEEKFKTTMMLIQASDNSSLLTEAYQLANQIPDQKERARALLDVVNEINYFTHQDPEQ
jgi:hypothetical protein